MMLHSNIGTVLGVKVFSKKNAFLTTTLNNVFVNLSQISLLLYLSEYVDPLTTLKLNDLRTSIQKCVNY